MVSVVTTIRRGINSSTAVKRPCKAATTANITLSGEQTLDGVAVTSGDRVLVKDQTDGSENGIYAVDSSTWQREPDWDGTFDVVQGTYVYVAQGSTNNNFWQVSTADPITIGTTSVSLIATDPDSLLRTNLADTANGQGASLVGVEDSAGNFSGTTVEAVLAEIIADYAAVTNGNGASKIGIEDTAGKFTATQVEAALAEIMTKTLTKGADVASANALTLGADGNYFDITGTTAITSIGTLGIGRIVKLHFDGVLTLTHHSTDLVLPGAANITTEGGDEAEFFEYATGDWRCTSYIRTGLNKLYAGDMVQFVYDQDGEVNTGTTIMPNDDNIIQNDEGDQYLSLAITPKSTTNILRIDVVANCNHGSATASMRGALFQDTTANALASAVASRDALANAPACIVFSHYMVAGTTSSTTFKVRIGASVAGTTTFNGDATARRGGGVMSSTISITEIRA